jgi:hypothetical protein
MIRVQGFNRRFELLKTEGGLVRFGLVCLFTIFLILLGIFFYQNAVTTTVFVLGMGYILWWLLLKPKPVNFELTDTIIKLDTREDLVSSIESWSLVDFEERAMITYKVRGGLFREVYIDKSELTESGLVNQLTQKIPFNPDLDNQNVLFVVLRILRLY